MKGGNLRNIAFVIVKFKYKGENDEMIRKVMENIFVPYFGGINGRLDLIDVKNKEVKLGVFQEYYGEYDESIGKYVGEKVKSQVWFPLGIDNNYVPDTLEVVEVKP